MPPDRFDAITTRLLRFLAHIDLTIAILVTVLSLF
jgi:hypothetical protein